MPNTHLPTLRITSAAIGPDRAYLGPSLDGYAGHVEIDADLGLITLAAIRVKGHIRALSGSGLKTTVGSIEANGFIEAGEPGLSSFLDIKSGNTLYTRGTAAAQRNIDVAGDLTVGEQVRANSVCTGGSVESAMILLNEDFICEGDLQLKRDIVVGGSITTGGRMVCGGQILATRNISAVEIRSEGAVTAMEGEIDAPDGLFSRADVRAEGSIRVSNGRLQAHSACSVKGSIQSRQQISTDTDLVAFQDISSEAGISAGWSIVNGGKLRSGLTAVGTGIQCGLSIESGAIESKTGLAAGTSVRARSTIRVTGRIMAGLLASRPLTREEMTIEGNVVEGTVVTGLRGCAAHDAENREAPKLESSSIGAANPRRAAP